MWRKGAREVSTGEHKSQNWGDLDMAAVSLSLGVDWIWNVPDWARLYHLLVFPKARVGIEQAMLGFVPTEPCDSWIWEWARKGWIITPNIRAGMGAFGQAFWSHPVMYLPSQDVGQIRLDQEPTRMHEICDCEMT